MRCQAGEFVDAGGLYVLRRGPRGQLPARRVFRGQNLEGSKSADLPGEQPTKFEFVINLNSAKNIAVTHLPNLLARATKLIKRPTRLTESA